MPFLEWNASYATGIPAIDHQHQQLFALVNELHDAAGSGSREVSVSVLVSLVDYIQTHFNLEERLLESARYADLEAHRAEHHRFTVSVLQAHDDYLDGRAVLTDHLLPMVKDWLSAHILATDRKYIPLLTAAR